VSNDQVSKIGSIEYQGVETLNRRPCRDHDQKDRRRKEEIAPKSIIVLPVSASMSYLLDARPHYIFTPKNSNTNQTIVNKPMGRIPINTIRSCHNLLPVLRFCSSRSFLANSISTEEDLSSIFLVATLACAPRLLEGKTMARGLEM
jgi:hypothetical protein